MAAVPPHRDPEGEPTRAELLQELERLRRTNADLQQFAYIASHDLQEPLRLVASYARLISNRYRGQLDPKADQYIDHVVDAAARMSDLIRALLELSRINSRAAQFAAVPAGSLISNAVQKLSAELEAAKGTVVHDLDFELCVDVEQMEAAFVELISNTLKFAREGVPPRLEISGIDRGDTIELHARDHGIGFEPRHQDAVFELFRRLSPRTHQSGRGFGLTFVRRVVDRHGGQVRAEGRPGEGATIVITLPKQPPKPFDGS